MGQDDRELSESLRNQYGFATKKRTIKMGMSTHIEFIVPPDSEFKLKYKAYKACQDANIPPPKELEQYFNYEKPDEAGVVISDHDLNLNDLVKNYNGDSCSGVEVDLTLLPERFKKIRFYNAY